MILKKCDLDHFTKCGQFSNIFLHLKKTSVEPENSNNLYVADSSTPLNRAFFVRKFRTPKINLAIDLFSMVERNGKGSPFAVFHVSQFLSLLCSTAQTLRSLAVVPENFYVELSKMLYKFLLLGKNRLHLTILADSEQQARNHLSLTRAICYARINPKHSRSFSQTKVCPNLDTPPTEQKSILLKNQSAVSIGSTTKHNGGNRSRKSSGIFLPKNHTLNTATSGRCVSIEFVARATPRNKAEFIRTNKGGYHPLWLVVEPLPRLLSVGKLSINNITENLTMLFKFLLLGKKRLTIAIRAKSEAEARQQLNLSKNQALFIGQINTRGRYV